MSPECTVCSVIQAKTVGPVKNPNCKFTFVQLVRLLVLYPCLPDFFLR